MTQVARAPRRRRSAAANALACLGFAAAAYGAEPPPITIATGAAGKNYFNLSLDGLLVVGASTEPDVAGLQTGGHDPAQRGFTVQNVETVFEGAVDPYFRGQANIVLQITPDGQTSVELEEVYATTSSLPHNLQVKAGQFLTEFGRLNPTHPHTWDFVDQPLVNGRLFGPDGLRSVGARVSWLMPTAFYSELLLAIQNAHGETLHSFGNVEGETIFGRDVVATDVQSAGDLLWTPRYTASFDLTDTQTLVGGVSSAYGPNGTGESGTTRIDGVDLFWKWKSPRAQQGFPFVKAQAESMWRVVDAAATSTLPATTFRDRGAYAQVVWGPRVRWVFGLRYDRVDGDVGEIPADPTLDRRWRVAGSASWYPSEYSKLRLQVSRDGRTELEDATSVWLQLEFLLGAHAAHKF